MGEFQVVARVDGSEVGMSDLSATLDEAVQTRDMLLANVTAQEWSYLQATARRWGRDSFVIDGSTPIKLLVVEHSTTVPETLGQRIASFANEANRTNNVADTRAAVLAYEGGEGSAAWRGLARLLVERDREDNRHVGVVRS